MGMWTENEVKTLKKYYSNCDWSKLLELFPNKTKQQIIDQASKNKIKKENYYWNEHEIQTLKEQYGKVSTNEVYSILNGKFTISAIKTKASKLDLVKNRNWTNNEIQSMIDNYSTLSAIGMVNILPNRTINSIRLKAIKLGLKSDSLYSNEEIKYIKNHYKDLSDVEISNNINRTHRSVKAKRCELGLFKLKEAGNFNSIQEFLRRNNKRWKFLSIKNCNFKCIITGNRFHDVHHLYGMNLILNEAISNIDFDIENCNLTTIELTPLLNEFLIVQNNYPLGVCLSKNKHIEFHNKYGYGNNTPSQFEEFLVEQKIT